MGTITERREQDFLRYRESVVVDESTWVGENLETHLEKPLRYIYENGELWSEQRQRLGPIFEKSVEYYRQVATEKPEFDFQYRRALAEQREYQHMLAMARGEQPNMLAVVSPLPKELHGQEKGVLGYQPKRGLGFLRVISREDDGSLMMWTHSFDRSDDSHVIEAIYQELGASVSWDKDVLEQPVALDVPSKSKRELLKDTLLYAVDSSLTRRLGGAWFAGRSDSDRREAMSFVMQQRDLLYAHVDKIIHLGTTSEAANAERYKFAAAMRRRFEGNFTFMEASGGDVGAELNGAGNEAASRGEQADGCGLTISATVNQELQAAGYKLTASEEWRYGNCRICLQSRMVGPCVICRDCAAADDRGEDLLALRERALQRQKKEQERLSSYAEAAPSIERKRTKANQLKYKYGAHARIVRHYVIGGAVMQAIDRQSGEVIDQF